MRCYARAASVYIHNAHTRSRISPTERSPRRFSLYGRHVDSAAISRDEIEARIRAREFGAVIFGTASRTTALLPVVREVYPPSRVGFVYGEDMPYPISEGLPVEGVQRPRGSAPTLPSVAAAAQWGVVFQRELYDDATERAHREQRLFVPGVADVVERPWVEELVSTIRPAGD